jgi:hypothetical protein
MPEVLRVRCTGKGAGEGGGEGAGEGGAEGASEGVISHKYRGSCVAFSISKSVEPNEELKVG